MAADLRSDARSATAEARALEAQSWQAWLERLFPRYVAAGFAQRHIDFWEWVWAIEDGTRSRPFIAIWPRGGGKSASAELATVAVGARGTRRYGLYICGKQTLADDHVGNVAALLESPALTGMYPALTERLVGKYGNSKGWRRNRLRTNAGFTLDALGLDVAARGIKLEEQRPDFMIFDDIDQENDTIETTEKRIRTVTRKLLPAGSSTTTVLGVQNMIHPDSMFAQIADRRTDMLRDRILSGPYPALLNPVYDEARGDLLDGEPTWEGQNLTICKEQVEAWTLPVFRAESQHEAIAQYGRFLPTMGLWDACQMLLPPLDAHTPVVMALDAGESSDTFACVLVGAHPTVPGGVAVRYSRAYVPDGRALNFDEIEADILGLIQRYAVVELTYDPFLLGQFLRRLQATQKPLPPLLPFPQGQARLEGDKGLLDLIEQRRIGHDGDAVLRAHLDNANKKLDSNGRHLRIVKRRQSLKIDMAVCLAMASARWIARMHEPSKVAPGILVQGGIRGW